MAANRDLLVLAASGACLLACVGDAVVPFALGRLYPGYSQLKQVVSELGASQSPVAGWMNLWWILFGALMVIFAVGFQRAFPAGSSARYVLMVQFIVFGIGAGIGAGLFPMDAGGSGPTFAGRLHNILSGIGFLAILLAPMVSLQAFPIKEWPWLHWFCVITQITGLLTLGLLLASGRFEKGLLSYHGLWQRVFLLNYDVYLAGIGLTMMWRDTLRCGQSLT